MDRINNKKTLNLVKSKFIVTIKIILISILFAFLVEHFIFYSTLISGNSMYPTLLEDDRLFSVKLPLYFRDPKVGEIIVFRAPDSLKKDYIKRVIAVPGDIVKITDGKVYVNDIEIKESYIEKDIDTLIYGEDKWVVEDGKLFVMGDNRRSGASMDSRYFDSIDNGLVKGVVNTRYYPFDSRVGKINK